MSSPFDVDGTIAPKSALSIVIMIGAGLVLAFTPLSVVGYLLLAAAAVLYVVVSVRAVSRKK